MNLNINFIAYIISAYTGKIYFTQKTTHPRSRAKAIAAARVSARAGGVGRAGYLISLFDFT